MSTFQNNCNSDFRNEGWTVTGTTTVNGAWSAIGDDTKFCTSPTNKGRACVGFPIDISSGSIPDGSVIESITIKIRCAKTDSATRSVTINLLCSDDTSHFTQRTIFPTTTITTIEIATFTKDPLGNPWTKDRLNRLLVQLFCYNLAAVIRVYECYVVINYRKKPVVAVTLPSGTVSTASPTVAWTYTQADGDPQESAEYKIYTAAQQSAAAFNPDTSPATYPLSQQYTVKAGDSLFKIAAALLGDGTRWPQIYLASSLSSGDLVSGQVLSIPGLAFVSGDITSFTLPFALAQNDYYIYVRARSTHHARSDWANRAFTVSGAAPGVPGGSLGGVGTGGGGGFESVIADSTTSSAYLTLRDGSNILGLQESDFETLTDSPGFTATNCTLTQDTTVNYGTGGASLKLVAASAANMSADGRFLEIAPSTAVTVRAQVRAKVTGRTVNVNVLFWDASFSSVAGTITATGTDATGTWTEFVATGTTPAGAIYASVQIQVVSPVISEVHNVDHIGLMYGTGSAWSNGGHTSRNLLSDAASNADDPITTEPWTAAAASTYSRVTTSGTGSEGVKAFKMLYAGLTPSITFVATGTAFTDTSTGTGYTLNKPVGTADGDLLVAYVSSNGAGPAVAPTGWTVVDTATNSASSDLTVLMRDGLAADPTSWTGNLTSTATRKRAVVVGYRGAASTGLQFPQENIAVSTGGSLTAATPSVSNSDPGAWRLSAFAVNDDATGGTMTANIQQSASPNPISYVGKGGVFKGSNGTSYTINKPSGVVSGDLMIATVAVSDIATVNVPTGWTLVNQTQDTRQDSTMGILKRTAGVSEPASWSSSVSSSGFNSLVVQSVAYRNCADASLQFIAQNGTHGESATIDTPTVTNTNSSAWRVAIFADQTQGGSTLSSNEVSERCDDTMTNSFAMNVACYDSNGTVSTGSHTRTATVSNSSQLYSAHAWIGILTPLSSAPAAGANETKRQDATAGASNPWITLAVFDSNGVAATGATTVYGSFTPGSGTSDTSWCAWEGFLIPATATRAGEVGATLVNYVDISNISQEVINRAANQITVQAAFLGSTAGVPHLKLFSYIGNELISTQIAELPAFNTTVWTKAVTQFVLPTGTTRLKMGVAAVDRAVNDFVLYDRVSMAFGSKPVWRTGTGQAAHPVFDIPIIEYSEDTGDGFTDWTMLPGTSNALLQYDNLSGLCNFVDHSIKPLSSRRYRAKTVSYGLAGDTFVSGYGPVSTSVTLTATDWWLKDIEVPDNSMKLKVYNNSDSSGTSSSLVVGTTDSSAVFQPLGADRPLVITEGYKGDVIQIVAIVDRFDYAQLRDLLNTRRTLYLQSNIDNAWWVRPNGNISSAIQPTGQMTTNPLRFVTINFVEVDPEA